MMAQQSDFRAGLLRDLANPEESAAYLNAAREDSPEVLKMALRDVAEAQQTPSHGTPMPRVPRKRRAAAPKPATPNELLPPAGVDKQAPAILPEVAGDSAVREVHPEPAPVIDPTDPVFVARQRKELLRHREEILKRQHAPVAERVPEAEEQCQINTRNEAQARTLRVDRKILMLISEALERIKGGEYGLCGGCEQQIPVKRLLAVPSAAYCVRCQEEVDGRIEEDEVVWRPRAVREVPEI